MQILIIAAFSYWFAALSGIPDYLKQVLFRFGVKKEIGTGYTYVRLYPIDCEKCLGFWLGLINFWGINHFWLMAGCTSFLAIVIGLIVNKLR